MVAMPTSSVSTDICTTPVGSISVADIDEKDIQAIQQFIENALDLMLKGNTTNYHYLIQQLNPRTPKSDSLTRRKIYLALIRCISSIAKEPKAYGQLLDLIFKFEFILYEMIEITTYTQFIIHLVSSNTVYVVPTLQMLIRNIGRPLQLPPSLTPTPVSRPSGISIGSSFGASLSTPTEGAIDVDHFLQQRFQEVHTTLERVMQLVPTAVNMLFPILVEHFPHKRHDATIQVAYVQNLLKIITTYGTGLQERVLALIIDHLVAVDVEIKLEEQEEDVFTMDDFLDDDLLPPVDDKEAVLDEMADKLDVLMVIMFEYMEKHIQDIEQAQELFEIVLKVFQRSILNTHRSKYPQFLLFYICHVHPTFQDVLISELLSTSLDARTPPVTRQSCSAYLASFLARAKYISVKFIYTALYHAMKWMHHQMDQYQEAIETCSKATTFQESVYISTLQMVCYVVCYRGLEIAQTLEIVDKSSGYEFLRNCGWERLLYHPSTGYCPLAYCQPTVATEFVNFIETFDLVSEGCVDAIDLVIQGIGKKQRRNKTMERTVSPPTQSTSTVESITISNRSTSVLGSRQPLETFFPFDPYLLRRSFKFIGPFYIYWKHVDPMSSENHHALEAVKDIIRVYQEEHDSEVDADSDSDDVTSSIDAMSLCGSVPESSLVAQRYVSRSDELVISTSLEGGVENFDLPNPLPIKTRMSRHKNIISKTTFSTSPSSSPALPPHDHSEGVASFSLTLFDQEVEEDGF